MTPIGERDSSMLDNPAWAALSGPHSRFAETADRAARYPADISPFAAVSDWDDAGSWSDLAGLGDAGDLFALGGVGLELPADWEVQWRGNGVQLVGTRVDPADDTDDADAVVLTSEDVPEMLDLVARNEPGPFAPRTIELGRYLGIRRGGALVSMAGERMRLPGWTEISAVCTDEAYRGQGMGSRLVSAISAGILRRGERPFMHAEENNTTAIRLYESLGFKVRARITFALLRMPEISA